MRLRYLLAKINYIVEYTVIKIQYSLRYRKYRMETRNRIHGSFPSPVRKLLIITGILGLTAVLLFSFFPYSGSRTEDTTARSTESHYKTQEGTTVKADDIGDLGVEKKAERSRPRVEFGAYTVRKGDTLWGIAKEHDISIDTLVSANEIKDLATLSVGKDLRIPTLDGISYRVRANDTLSRISLAYGVAISAITEFNELSSDLLDEGQTLFLPGAKLSAAERNRLFGVDLMNPVPGRLTSRYGIRAHPFLGYRMFHSGVDVGYNSGYSVRAAQSGTVSIAGEYGGFGNYVSINHKSGFVTGYGHLSSVIVTSGQYVKKGQVLGYVGSTGISTGPHLHFEVLYRGKYVNPLSYVHY
ncbi:MAG: M23 family metallopeptidase [Spirochaetota bacterium]